MDRFGSVDDWDLHAVVRECGRVTREPDCDFVDCSDLLEGFPGFDGTNPSIILDGLEELFDADSVPFSSEPMIVEDAVRDGMATEAEELDHRSKGESELRSLAMNGVDNQGKQRRRRNQHRSVVHHVTAEGISADMWAWRKYGQKPIKGSPYPRSYYRCSSSKGCLARKQVERSRSDPAIFIITYTGEHGHTHPARRNPLAGSVRNKRSSSSSSPSFHDYTNHTTTGSFSCRSTPGNNTECLVDGFRIAQRDGHEPRVN